MPLLSHAAAAAATAGAGAGAAGRRIIILALTTLVSVGCWATIIISRRVNLSANQRLRGPCARSCLYTVFFLHLQTVIAYLCQLDLFDP